MDQKEFRQARESGELVTDAALQGAETEIIPDDRYQEQDDSENGHQNQDDEQEGSPDESESIESDENDEEEQLSPKEKDAFLKRMERERAKLEEKLRAEMEQQFEGKYSKHREAIEHLGGDPDAILKAAQEAKMMREAEALADRNNWTTEETQWYIEQQKQQQELKELRVQMQINRLKDNPDYAGIGGMERDILAKIDKTNGALNVEEAYWALGGPKRAEQIKLEAQQREIANRAKPTRTVQRDSPSSNTGEKPLDPKVLAEAKRMGTSEAEARKLMNAPDFQNIDEYREWKRKQAK